MLKKRPLLFIFVTTLLHITSCNSNEYEYESTNYEVRGGGTISDTTAIILRIVIDNYSDELKGWGGESRLREVSLNLVDMRFEKIYWKKNIAYDDGSIFAHMDFDIIDSTLFFYTLSGIGQKNYAIRRIAVVHMDEKFHQSQKIELKYKDINLNGEGWKSYAYPKVRLWKNGLILANSKYWDGISSGDHYALLDTAAGTMELWQPSGEFEWLDYECADYKWSQIGGLCLKDIPDTSGFVLLVNGVDTLAVRYYTYTGSNRRSSVFSGNNINSMRRAYLINQHGQVSENHLNVLVAYGFVVGTFYRFSGTFYDLNGNLLVSYEYDRFER